MRTQTIPISFIRKQVKKSNSQNLHAAILPETQHRKKITKDPAQRHRSDSNGKDQPWTGF